MKWPFFSSGKEEGQETEPAHLRAGKWGEEQAARYLKEHGFKLEGTRVRVGRRDELDLVARDGKVLVFVEVKTRANEDWGRPFASVNRAKRKALTRAAWTYLKRLRVKPAYFRFDVIEVVGREGDEDPVIRHLPNAFNMPAHFRLPW